MVITLWLSLISGMAYEGLKEFDSVLEIYMRASDYIHETQPAASYYSVQLWISKIMYRLCMLSLRLRSPEDGLIHFRRYKRLVETQFKVTYGLRERLAVYYWYWRILSELVKQKIQKPAPENEKASTDGEASWICHSEGAYDRTADPQVELNELKDELSEIQSEYETILNSMTKFPGAGNTNQLYDDSHGVI